MSEGEVNNCSRIAMQLYEAFEPPQPLLEYQQAPLPYPVEALAAGRWTGSAPTRKPCFSFCKKTKAMMMALVGRSDGRNFGYGHQLSYADPQALKDLFAGGHFVRVKAHSDRRQELVHWCRSEDGPGYNDANQIDRRTLLDYTD